VVTAARMLVEACTVYDGKYARSLPAYGHERRGAPVFADVMIDEAQILLSSFVYDPDCVMLFEPSLVSMGVDISKGIGDHTVLLVNAGDLDALDEETVNLPWKDIYHVSATAIALEIMGRAILNSPMLGALAKTGVVGIESVCGALKDVLGTSTGESNIRAARKAYEQAHKA
jgi:2-oxoacid:acceptor oxidoreductase gamma subunit (pyruvate/2-ketoisovalerate family)